MFFTVIFIAVVLVAVLVYLPYSSGLVSYEKNRSVKKSKPAKAQPADQPRSYGGYIPPDEAAQPEKESMRARASAVKDHLNVTAEDMPVKIKLANTNNVRRRKDKLDIDRNPNTYDYDLDELINEPEDVPTPPQVQPAKPFSKEIV